MASTKRTTVLAHWTPERALQERVLFEFRCYVLGKTVYPHNASLSITLVPENFFLLKLYY